MADSSDDDDPESGQGPVAVVYVFDPEITQVLYTLLDSTTADQSLVYNNYWPEAVSNPSKSNIMGHYEAELPPCPTDDPRGLARRLTVREFRVTLRRCAAGRDL
ncbi:hypothetical protein X801_08858 [Opisthorchis viverrini]|uniref:Uncharacterized protein n=1 Tax=Opisthorchis viverrini TaxID=6198 RepID=A0A1S8WLM0_OPIVI|nr:hypothetical protein X801_08858 [Opisthorchis viverrini]